MKLDVLDLSFAFLIFAGAIGILIIILAEAWDRYFRDWWKKQKQPKTFRIVVDLDKLVVNSSNGIMVDCFKDSRRNKVHLIIREEKEC